MKNLDKDGLSYLWQKLKKTFVLKSELTSSIKLVEYSKTTISSNNQTNIAIDSSLHYASGDVLNVYINGFRIEKSSWSISGNNVVLSFALSQGAVIELVNLKIS